jgi:hypothetical protein
MASEVSRLRERLSAAEEARDAAESECAALRAEVERLRADRDANRKQWRAAAAAGTAAESRLAAANALLERCQQAVSPVSLLGRDVDAHLAARGAGPTAREPELDTILMTPKGRARWDAVPVTFAGTPRVGIEEQGLGQTAAPARTEAEQAVLDAMANATEKDLNRGHRGDWAVAVLTAELARRALSPKGS